jgi:hypothetical protein
VVVLPDAKGFGPAPVRAALLPAPSDTCIEYPLPNYAIMENVDGTDPLPNSCVDRSPRETREMPKNPDKVYRTLAVDTCRSAQQPKETWGLFSCQNGRRRKAVESGKDIQHREALEANARENGHFPRLVEPQAM